MTARVLLVVGGVAGLLWGLAGSAAASCHRGVTYTAGADVANGCEGVAKVASGVTVGLVAAGVLAFVAFRVLLGQVGGGGKAGGPAAGKSWPGSGRTTEQLLNSADRLVKGGVTKGAQSYAKHAEGQRFGETTLPRLRGGPAQKAAIAHRHLGDILTNPATREVLITGGVFKGGHYYIHPSGRGAAFDAQGIFQYFGTFIYPG